MRLTPRELDKMLVFVAGEVARKRKERGLKLNQPEAIALISAEILELARDGMSVEKLMSYGSTILTEEDVMEGVAEMIPSVQVEATFPDGTKLVPIDNPIRPRAGGTGVAPKVVPGELILNDDNVTINEGLETLTLEVKNGGDRPVQVGSHYHFAETNPALEFDRGRTVGFRLDIPAGTAVRFEPGETHRVNLVAYGGAGVIRGFRGEYEGDIVVDGKVVGKI